MEKLSLDQLRTNIDELYRFKGWNRDWLWLFSALNIEVGELGQSVLKKEEEKIIAEEFADVMHYLLELMQVKCPNTDLQKALMDKIESNKKNLKKTTDSQGNVVLK